MVGARSRRGEIRERKCILRFVAIRWELGRRVCGQLMVVELVEQRLLYAR
jgi:hypothetical protein